MYVNTLNMGDIFCFIGCIGLKEFTDFRVLALEIDLLGIIVQSLQFVGRGTSRRQIIVLYKLLGLLNFISDHPLHRGPGGCQDILHMGHACQSYRKTMSRSP